jgi:hypothetical protein
MNPVGIVLAAAVACQPVPDSGQFGLWEATGTSMGGIGGYLELTADGSYYSAMAVLVDFVYKVEEGVLYIATDEVGPVEFTEGVPITLKDDGYVVLGAEGEEELRMRIGAGSGDSIVGEYSYRHYTGSIAYEKFTEDGLFYLRIPMTLEVGCYEIDGEELTLNPADGQAKSWYFRFEEGQLQLDNFDRVNTFNPAPGGAWYHVDEVDYVVPEGFEPEN